MLCWLVAHRLQRREMVWVLRTDWQICPQGDYPAMARVHLLGTTVLTMQTVLAHRLVLMPFKGLQPRIIREWLEGR